MTNETNLPESNPGAIYDEMYDKHMRELGSVKEEVLKEYGRQLDELYLMVRNLQEVDKQYIQKELSPALEKINRDMIFLRSSNGRFVEGVDKEYVKIMKRMDEIELRLSENVNRGSLSPSVIQKINEVQELIDDANNSCCGDVEDLKEQFNRLKVRIMK